MLSQTRRSLVTQVTAAVQGLHSYEVPESIAVDIAAGSSAAYLDWVRQSTAARIAPESRSPGEKEKQEKSTTVVDAVTGGVVEPVDPATEASVTQKYTDEGTTDAGSV